MTGSRAAGLARFVPAILGLACAALLTITLVTCSGFADRTLSDWVPSDDYGERAYDSYVLAAEDAEDAPDVTATPPDWVIGVATDSASPDDPSRSYTHLTYSFETGNVVLTYAADDVDEFLAWQLSEDTIITSHLFGGRYTNIVVGDATTADFGGRPVSWGTYAFDDEYGRRNVCYASASEVCDGEVLTIVATETVPDDADGAFLSEGRLEQLWEGVAW